MQPIRHPSGAGISSGYTPPVTPAVTPVPRAAACERRLACDEDGTEWVVYQMSAEHVPGARGPSCLVFDSPRCVRRVWDFPPDWAALADAELLAVSLRP